MAMNFNPHGACIPLPPSQWFITRKNRCKPLWNVVDYLYWKLRAQYFSVKNKTELRLYNNSRARDFISHRQLNAAIKRVAKCSNKKRGITWAHIN